MGLEHCPLGCSLSNPSTTISGSVPVLKSVGLGAEGRKVICCCFSPSDALAAFMLLVPVELRLCEVGGPGTQAAGTSIVGLLLLAGDTVRVPLDLKL